MESINKRGGSSAISSGSMILKALILLVVFVLGSFFVVKMLVDGQYAFGILFAVVIAAGLLTFGLKHLYPHRYIFPGVAGMVVFIIFPLVYTIYISFTNYSAKNLFTIERAEEYHLTKTYRLEGGDYKFDIVEREGGQYSLILTKPSQTLEDGTVEPEKVYASAPSKLISKEELMEKPTIQAQAKKSVRLSIVII